MSVGGGVAIESLWSTADYQERWQQLLGWLDARAGEWVLDVGFGEGGALRHVHARVGAGGRAVGVGPGVEAAVRLREATAGERQPDGIAGTAQALPFRDGVFDAVLCVNVLEAVPEPQRPLALAEMRRVLKVGGRVLLAHDDWESMAYAGADRELTRRCVRAYADMQFRSYAAADGQMGRHVWGLVKEAGFREPELRLLPLANTEYREPNFGWVHSRVRPDLVTHGSGVTPEEVDRWHAQLEAASERGTYAFGATLYACSGRK